MASPGPDCPPCAGPDTNDPLATAAVGSVWLTAQRSAAAQRRGRFVAGSGAHPARMLPAIAAHAIATYSRPGDLVLDPMCGIGTTLVEAVHASRDAFGVDLEPGWVALARANIALARRQGGTGHGRARCGDAARLAALVPPPMRGNVALVLTSPPYGRTMHGRVEHRRGPLTKFANSYGPPNPASLARRGLVGLTDGLTAILASCAQVLKPGGIVVVTARPWRRDGLLVDLPGAVTTAGIAAGLAPIQRCVALLAAVRDGRLIPRHSFFQLHTVRKARRRGIPLQLIAHEDVLVLQRPAGDGRAG
ncbi:MAG: hypothetical protein L0Y54_09960 [Sporichthyaceae bacterium]|nr:hypothetical protein [Sporichthyaceae bacterium]